MAVGGYMLGWICVFVGDDADDPQVFEAARGLVTRALQRASIKRSLAARYANNAGVSGVGE